MKLEECYKRIDRFISDPEKTGVRFVNFNNVSDMTVFKEHYALNGVIMVEPNKFSKPDEVASLSDLLYYLDNTTGVVIVSGFTTYIRLLGKEKLMAFISQMSGWSKYGIHVIVLTYQCEDLVLEADKRNINKCYSIDGENDTIPQLILLPAAKKRAFFGRVVSGVENIFKEIESENTDPVVYVLTNKCKSDFPEALYNIGDLRSSFDILRDLDPTTSKFEASYGTEEQWDSVVDAIWQKNGWDAFLAEKLGAGINLSLSIRGWSTFDSMTKWLFFLALKYFNTTHSIYLDYVAKKICTLDDIGGELYNSILDFDCKEHDYWAIYSERKRLILSFGLLTKESIEFCTRVDVKETEAIYYLTDLTENEKSLIIANLARYYMDYPKEQIIEILDNVYKDLSLYLRPYKFKQDYLTDYFELYKFNKITNQVTDEFIEMVNTQSKQRDFFMLPARTEKTEAIDVKRAKVFFIDAMGVEYLGFILGKCKEKNLRAKVNICRCELPSITSINKDFVEVFEQGGATFVPDKNGIKLLDKIKHHGVESFDYTQNPLPTYVSKELELMTEIMNKSEIILTEGTYNKIVIISDHGASRACVIYGHENKWEMQTKGVHSGRCCPKSDIAEKPDCATEESGYWVLANYDRFKGGRKANVEVHGGASLEEVLVPIIEITKNDVPIMVELKTPVISFIPRKKPPILKVYVSEHVDEVVVNLKGKGIDNTYYANTIDNKNFSVTLDNVQKAGDYSLDVYSNGEHLAANLIVTLKNAAFSTKNLF